MKLKLLNSIKRIPIPKLRLPDRFKGGRIEKLGLFWKSIMHDYKTVAVESFQESKAKPLKSVTTAGVLSFMLYAINTNPDELVFDSDLTTAGNDISLLSDSLRNPASTAYIKYMNDCQNAGLLRRQSLGFFSVMWLSNFHSDCTIYSAQCTYLKPTYANFYKRIVDFGFLGDWHVLKRNMVDYDVNPEEWDLKTAVT